MTINIAENCAWRLSDTTITKVMGDSSFVLPGAVSAIEGAYFSYSFSDETMATVNSLSGKLTIIGAGTCVIDATFKADGWAEDSKSVTLVVNNIAGLDSPVVDAFRIYPNPASVEVRVSGIDCDLIEVYSLSGNKLFEVNNSTIIPVSSLTPGAYMVKINGFTKQLLVK